MIYSQKEETGLISTDQEASLVVAFANLLQRFEKPIAPVELEKEMRDRGIVEIMFGSLSVVDSTVQVSRFGASDVPPSNDAIMKFEYISPVTNQPAIAYALIKDANSGTIIDSYSGIEKNWNVYGGVGSWATYTSIPIQAAVEPQPVAQEVVKVNDTTQPVTEPVAPVETAVASDAVAVPVKVVTPDPLAWQSTFKKGLGVIDTTSVVDATIHDLAGSEADQFLPAGTFVPVSGRFEKDGQAYYRTEKSVTEDKWFGIPAGVLVRTDKLNEDEDISAIFESSLDETPKDKVIKTAATIEGKAKGLFSFGRKK